MDAFQFLSENDLPNWAVLLITFFASLLPWLWEKRKLRHIRGLEIHPKRGRGKLDERNVPVIKFRIVNNTGMRVFVQNARLHKITKNLKVHPESRTDLSTNSCELKFLSQLTNEYDQRYILIETNSEAITCICLTEEVSEEISRFSSSWMRRVLRRPRFFLLQYSAMVGDRRRTVATIF